MRIQSLITKTMLCTYMDNKIGYADSSRELYDYIYNTDVQEYIHTDIGCYIALLNFIWDQKACRPDIELSVHIEQFLQSFTQ